MNGTVAADIDRFFIALMLRRRVRFLKGGPMRKNIAGERMTTLLKSHYACGRTSGP